MKKIKVALVAPYPAQRVLSPENIKPDYRDRAVHPASWVRSLTHAYAKRGDVEFWVFSHSRAVSRVCHGEDDGVQYTFIPKYEPARLGNYHLHWPARLQFRKHIKTYAPDLVHGFGTESAYGVIATEQGIPSVVFIQGIQEKLIPYYDHFSKIQKQIRVYLEGRVLKQATGLIAETDFAGNWADENAASDCIAVIPHAVNAEFFTVQPTFKKAECLCVGTISRIKAVDTSIRALSKTKNRELHLCIIGTGPLLSEMKELVRKLGITDRVELCGYMNRDQIMDKMSNARMLTILSRMDTSPNVLTEAHAAGLPVIGSRAGGIPDMVVDGKDGFLVDVDDAEAVAKKMDLLVGNPDLCKTMGMAGRIKVQQLNDPDQIADQHIEFYRKILAK